MFVCVNRKTDLSDLLLHLVAYSTVRTVLSKTTGGLSKKEAIVQGKEPDTGGASEGSGSP